MLYGRVIPPGCNKDRFFFTSVINIKIEKEIEINEFQN
jgi:hypothetical protein